VTLPAFVLFPCLLFSLGADLLFPTKLTEIRRSKGKCSRIISNVYAWSARVASGKVGGSFKSVSWQRKAVAMEAAGGGQRNESTLPPHEARKEIKEKAATSKLLT
jgi:hypothetical protein